MYIVVHSCKQTYSHVLFSVVAFALLLFTVSSLQAQTVVQEPVKVERDTTEEASGSILAIPVVGYTPETKFTFGGGAIAYFHIGKSETRVRPSSVLADFIYTQLGQMTVQVIPQLYFSGEKYFVESELSFIRFADKFWGVGTATTEQQEEEFTNDIMRFRATLLRRLPPFVNFGLQLSIQDYRMKTIEEGRQLDTSEIEGQGGARVAGIGIVVNYDSRDFFSSATRGDFHQFQTILYNRALGGTHNFTHLTIDARKYIPLADKHTLALQLYASSIIGEAPFQLLARTGGGTRMRGYFDGRFRDNSLVAMQAEYRLMPFWWLLGATAFVSAGHVGRHIGDILTNPLLITGGVGLRIALIPEERTFLRLDFGVGRGTNGFYFGIQEAF